MADPNEISPSTARGRFFAGFGLAAFFTFLGLGMYPAGRDWLEAIPAALVVGSAVGAISAWGKRCFAFFFELFTRYGP